jgi:hypothetical protein
MKRRFLFVFLLIFACSGLAFGDRLYTKDWTADCTMDWTIVSGDWGCGAPNGLFFTDNKGTILATPVFAGCDLCRIENIVSLHSGHVSFLGWYQDENNFVELTAHRKANGMIKWTLTQFVNGAIAARESGEQIGFEDFSDESAVIFDGVTFTVIIDQSAPLFQMEKAPGSTPFGTVGYEHKHANAKFLATIVCTGQFPLC